MTQRSAPARLSPEAVTAADKARRVRCALIFRLACDLAGCSVREMLEAALMRGGADEPAGAAYLQALIAADYTGCDSFDIGAVLDVSSHIAAEHVRRAFREVRSSRAAVLVGGADTLIALSAEILASAHRRGGGVRVLDNRVLSFVGGAA